MLAAGVDARCSRGVRPCADGRLRRRRRAGRGRYGRVRVGLARDERLRRDRRQVDAFLADNSSNAFEVVIDELLKSPHFGERWARHWMDLMRYAETYGHEFDYPIPHAYKYRDYLIRAFNADVPYDRFVKEHITGDLIAPRFHPTDGYNESVIGTSSWWLGEATHAPVDVTGDEAGRIDNQIDVMSKTFLGLTVACARCHDHKFDAISTKDYYALSGFLQSSRRDEVLLDPHGKIESAPGGDRWRQLWQQQCAPLAGWSTGHRRTGGAVGSDSWSDQPPGRALLRDRTGQCRPATAPRLCRSLRGRFSRRAEVHPRKYRFQSAGVGLRLPAHRRDPRLDDRAV